MRPVVTFLRRVKKLRFGPIGTGISDASDQLSEEQLQIFRALEQTDDHTFVTGKAGTGKSVLLEYFAANTRKTVLKVAPTGVAAMRIKGQTIHSLFKLPTGFVDINRLRVREETEQLFRCVDAIIIDEISMVRADIVDGMNHVLQTARKNKLPFGGVQIIAFGDVYQLPPVVAGTALRNYFAKVYDGPYFFSALVWKEAGLQAYELKTVFRQSNSNFRAILDAIRNGAPAQADFDALHRRVVGSAGLPRNVVTLASTNAAASIINQQRITNLKGKKKSYHAIALGEVDTKAFPTDEELTLRVGAQVIFLKNDPGHRWVNGTIGTVKSLSKYTVRVACDRRIYNVKPVVWEQLQYHYDEHSGALEQKTTGTFTQLPLRLAWAMTIHKSQGCTYDRVAIDLRSGAFIHGQTYVALSRCRSLAGLFLLGELKPSDIIVDPTVKAFMRQVQLSPQQFEARPQLAAATV